MSPILPGAPWLVAHRSMLGINKPFKIKLNGHDYVLWQNSQGQISALDNICPHMQASLADGWINADRNTITCPFHALEFDSAGRYCNAGQVTGQPLVQSLSLEIRGDLIWTYGGHTPQIPIPDTIDRLSQGFEFIGTTIGTSINGTFLSNLLVNYDYNHQNGTHRELFRLKDIQVSDYVENGNCTTLKQHLQRDKNTISEVLKNPTLQLLPTHWTNDFEYAFPCLTTLKGDLPVGRIFQIHSLYPEDENHTQTFILLFAQLTNPIVKRIKNFLKPSMLKSVQTVIDQDSVAIEHSYPRTSRKIKLPNEHIMDYAEKLYHNWPMI